MRFGLSHRTVGAMLVVLFVNLQPSMALDLGRPYTPLRRTLILKNTLHSQIESSREKMLELHQDLMAIVDSSSHERPPRDLDPEAFMETKTFVKSP